jgi:predicted RNA-binding protein (virulence factor B family)
LINLGKYNTLTVAKEVNFGIYLRKDGVEILMPTKWVPSGVKIGDELEVFVYKDSDDRLIATTMTPLITANSFAFLDVQDVNDIGAFLDWGMQKHLLVPFREQQKRMYPNQGYVVYAYVDEVTNRLVASSKLKRFIEHEPVDLKRGDEVDLLVYSESNLGFSAIINNKYSGLIYKDEVYETLRVGDKLKGYIKEIRDDNKIDLSLKKLGYEQVGDAKEYILEALTTNKGYLPLGDHSSPEEIKSALQMSKKSFKKAIGALYKERQIEITPKGIKLLS